MSPRWTLLHPRATEEHLGFLPQMLSTFYSLPARDQFNEGYSFAGGWQPFQGFHLDGTTLTYPGDPPMQPIAETHLREERILLYPSSWVMILQPDGSFEVARMD